MIKRARLNITLPEEIAKKLSNIPNKSRFIAQVLKEKFEQQEKERLKSELKEGYKSLSKEMEKINKEWEKADLEGWK